MWLLCLRRFDRDVGLVLASFVVLLALENLGVGLGWRSEFASPSEMGSARLYLSPIALAFSIPVAISAVLMARLAAGRRAAAVGFLGVLGGAALAIGVSTGRRMASVAVRAPFVVVVALVAGLAAWLLARELLRTRRGVVAGAGALVAVLAWLADAFVLPRLYPAFHLALFFVTLIAWSATSLVFARLRASVVNAVALAAIVVASASLAWAPHAAVKVGTEDNLRRVLLERAPILGRSVEVASKMAPPPPVEEDAASEATLAGLRAQKGGRALDWNRRDIVLVTIDALRADHVSAYGYARKTTPNIDALAARGARFERAYCPTPHTSYSIASLMTGKYMKPLLALGTNEDTSETWPVQLRRYGYRTAAFYPPAVFFIDEHRFRRMRDESLGFEYKKEEFADAELRRAQIERYLSAAPKDKPLFLWVHLFEPHEPYEPHAEFPFEGDPRVDAYDSEIAAADALVGDVVALVEAKRPPGAVFIVSADHGEEHGDHGGRYHGTTVYEEQVRVPLVVVGPGVAPRVIAPPVQTIDLLPTSLAALDVPIPPRVRGRDLGPALAGTAPATDQGLAFAETDDYTLVARGDDRLVCQRKIGSCTLFDVARDPGQTRPLNDERRERVDELKKLTAAIERETGKLEVTGLPDALRRGLQGDRDAAEDVAPLLDDARVDIRRLAARCAFKLAAPEMAAQLERSETHDDDAEVRRWSSLARLRIDRGEAVARARLDAAAGALGVAIADDERYAAALALAEHGDARGERELLARWSATFTPGSGVGGELDDARAILAAFGVLRSKAAVPLLIRALDDVRLRPYVIEALADIGDARAKDPLLEVFAEERYVHLRALEAQTLFKLGAREKLIPALTRFAGTPEPLAEAIVVAREAKLLTADRGGWVAPTPPTAGAEVALRLRVTRPGPSRLLVLAAENAARGDLHGTIGDEPAEAFTTATVGRVFVVEVGDLEGRELRVSLSSQVGIAALWLVPRADEIPPPPPRAWDAGASSDAIPP
ncbi:MAG: sulfatase-like hydrolase/transferase [Labilithrix sp.]|nr:sulfatase-like hydrolase/transferase [Labilithrix sp.]